MNRLYARRKFDDPLDRRIAECAAGQQGTVAVRQIVAFGLSASALRDRVASGRLHRVYSGVVAVMPPRLLTRKGFTMAATLACRPGTLATHRAASALHELRLAQRAWIDVTTPGARGHRRAGIRVHNGTTLTAADVFVIDNVPCTTLARTLLDVAEDATRREVERALDVAEQRADPRHARDRRRPLTRRRPARRQAPARRPGRAHRRQHADAQRPRGGVSRDLPCRRAPARRGERVDRVPRGRRRGGRLPLARAQPDRRGRRARPAHHPQGVQRRPPARCAAHAPRLARRALHLAAGHVRAGLRRGDASRPARMLSGE